MNTPNLDAMEPDDLRRYMRLAHYATLKANVLEERARGKPEDAFCRFRCDSKVGRRPEFGCLLTMSLLRAYGS